MPTNSFSLLPLRVWTSCLALAAIACGGAPEPITSASVPAESGRSPPETGQDVPSHIHPARMFLLPATTDTVVDTVDPDGTRRSLTLGYRLLERPDGVLLVSSESFPPGNSMQAVELPRRFESRYLFYAQERNRTNIWSAKSWTGELTALAELSFEVESFVPGFDRLYATAPRKGRLVALDPDTGEAVSRGSLPQAPTYGSMAFGDAWLGAIEVPLRGVLATFDAGGSWHPLPLNSPREVALFRGEITVADVGQRYALERDGVLRPLGPIEDEREQSEGSEGQKSRTHVWSDRPLRLAVLRGWPDSASTAVFVDQGRLARVRLLDGKVIVTKQDAVQGDCQALPFGDGVGFACTAVNGMLSLHKLTEPLGLLRVRSFREARYVTSSFNGSLVVGAACSGENAPGAHCVVTADGNARAVTVTGDQGIERVVALSHTRAAVIVPPRLGQEGFLSILEEGKPERRKKLELPDDADPSAVALLEQGLWLRGFYQVDEGELGGWVAGGGPFMGIRIGLDGKVRLGKMFGDVSSAILSGPFGLAGGAGGRVFETIDGGLRWTAVGMHDRADLEPGLSSGLDWPMGCSAVGCAFGPWLRIGYDDPDKERVRLAEVELPSPAREPSPGGGRWSLQCAHPEVVSDRALKRHEVVQRHRRQRGGRAMPIAAQREELSSSAWQPFRELSPPSRNQDEIGFDVSSEPHSASLRSYVWGPPGADWNRAGSWSLSVADPFSLDEGVWSTAVSPSPWNDAIVAAQVFGHESTSTPSSWTAQLDPDGRAGALLVSSSGGLELFLFGADQPVVPVPEAAQRGMGPLSGVVKLEDTWYVGSLVGSRGYRVFRIHGQRMELLGEYPLMNQGSAVPVLPKLARDARGERLGLWVNLGGWYVYPIELGSGRIEAPLVIMPRQLADTPESCSGVDDGWLLVGEPAISPYVEFPDSVDVKLRRLSARVYASAAGVCIDSLAADVEFRKPARIRPRQHLGRTTFPLVMSNADPGGARWLVRCSDEIELTHE